MEAAQAGVPDAANTALSITPEQRPRNEAAVMSQPDDGHSICSDGSIASSTTDINYMEHDDDTGGPYQEVRSRKRTQRNNSNCSSETIIQSKAIEEGLTVVFAPADTETLITSLCSVKLSRALENSCPEGIHEVGFNSRLNVIAVDTRNGEATKTLLNLKALCGIPVMSYSPLAGTTVNGIIQDVDKELSNEEITSHLRSNIKVGAVRRLGKSSTVKVTFRGKILPTHVLLGNVRLPVHPFQERLIQCLNCFEFGHKRVACRRPKSWTERLVCDKNTYTETINLTTETPEVDRHLLHLWEARHGLIKRWKRQKLNRKLKKRIEAITVEALEYATQLAQKLLKLGVHNTFRELVDSHFATQRDRLAQTPAGRKVLESVKIPFQWDREDTTVPLPRHIWSQIKVHTIPRNMDPTLHAERRKARARFYQKAYGQRADVLYTDAATYAYQRNAAAICVVDGTGSTRITASLRTSNTTIAEEFAIAEAIGLEDHVSIMSDSQAALRRFLAGRVSPKALKVLTQRDRQGFPTVELIWIPGHDEVKGNRYADTQARACTLRAAPAAASRLGIDSYFIPVPNRYSEIRAYHRGRRREYLPPHKNLNREDAVAWRQLQTGAPPSHPDPNPENWEAALLSSTAADQLKLIGRARLTADSVGALD
ncbi:hypothetical protein HPB47_012601 [Ixodes persulcatus]|uniref:Uncharacterized protein n=1 Tax=Ixodes persulcatus TaxID=34615 RepID=A0AC60NT20_IXOPE|nr:hypothetical protein HPB47_012601 [Ixodes persulcatus]